MIVEKQRNKNRRVLRSPLFELRDGELIVICLYGGAHFDALEN